MAWGQIILAFIAGVLLGPWLLGMFGGKKQAAAQY